MFKAYDINEVNIGKPQLVLSANNLLNPIKVLHSASLFLSLWYVSKRHRSIVRKKAYSILIGQFC